jgi:hypothetical protein
VELTNDCEISRGIYIKKNEFYLNCSSYLIMGCGSSFPILPSIKNHNTTKPSNTKTTTGRANIKSGKLPPIKSDEKLNKNKEKREKNLEPFTLVCLDEHFHENDKQLRSIIDYVFSFDDLEKCEEFITDSNHQTFIFFIVSSEYFTNMISHIHDLSQLIAIYVFQDNKSNIDKHWTKRYSKVNKLFYFYGKIFILKINKNILCKRILLYLC